VSEDQKRAKNCSEAGLNIKQQYEKGHNFQIKQSSINVIAIECWDFAVETAKHLHQNPNRQKHQLVPRRMLKVTVFYNTTPIK